MNDDEYFDYFATLLAKKLNMSKQFVKYQLSLLEEGGSIDPWIQHIMLIEAFQIIVQQSAMVKPMLIKH